MKIGSLFLALGATLFLSTAPARAVTLDFLNHNYTKSDNDHSSSYKNYNSDDRDDDDFSGKHKNLSSWNNDFGKDKDDKKFGSDSSWGNHPSFDDDWKNSKIKHDHDIPAPFFVTSGFGYFDKHHDHDHDRDDRGDKDWGRGDKGKYDRDDCKRYYHEICDGDDYGGRHHHGRGWNCDPGDPGSPAPLPDSLPLFLTGLMALYMVNQMRRASRSVDNK